MPRTTPQTSLPRALEPTGRVRDLRTGELLVVAVVRLWAAFISEPDRTEPQWQEGLAAAEVEPEGAAAFDTLFRIVVAATRRPLDIHRAQCPMLGSDEARFLAMIHLAQQGCQAEVGAMLGDWLPPAAVRMALPPLCLFAGALYRADLAIPLRGATVPAAARFTTPVDHGASLLH